MYPVGLPLYCCVKLPVKAAGLAVKLPLVLSAQVELYPVDNPPEGVTVFEKLKEVIITEVDPSWKNRGYNQQLGITEKTGSMMCIPLPSMHWIIWKWIQFCRRRVGCGLTPRQERLSHFSVQGTRILTTHRNFAASVRPGNILTSPAGEMRRPQAYVLR